MPDSNIARGDLFYLWHPNSTFTFSGYGLAVAAGRKDLLVGILMVDRPYPVAELWLASVEETFGGLTLQAMTVSRERGMACQMRVDSASLPYALTLDVPLTQPLAQALTPLLAQPPKPHFVVKWDPVRELWISRFEQGADEQLHRNAGAQHPQGESSQPMRPAKLPLFPLGQVVATPGALAALVEAEQSPDEFISRHVTGDWGSLPPEDIAENRRALKHGHRLFSSYRLSTGTKLWLLTEHDRSVTTLLLPSDY